MIYCQTINEERIAVHHLDDIDNTQYVELMKCGNEPTFMITIYDGEDQWFWEFNMSVPSDYERVKLSVFDAIFVCDTMEELAEALNAIFENDFKDILITDDEFECCDECEDCDGCPYIR